MFITNPNFDKPYELIERSFPNEYPGGSYLWKEFDTVWKVEKIETVKFKGDTFTTDIVYLVNWKNPAEWDFVDGLSFINGYIPVGTVEEGLIHNFFKNLCLKGN